MSERNEFSVCQFFVDEGYEYVCRYVSVAEAVERARACTRSVGAKIGTTRRVIITDGGDQIAFEWKFGQGITYPEPGTAQEEEEEK
jgi:hypothetical protein